MGAAAATEGEAARDAAGLAAADAAATDDGATTTGDGAAARDTAGLGAAVGGGAVVAAAAGGAVVGAAGATVGVGGVTVGVALAARSGGEQLPRVAAARWLRQRATGGIQIVDFERHQHQALIIASTVGWRAVVPLSTNQLGFTLRRYDAAGAQDPDHGDWLIDVLEAE